MKVVDTIRNFKVGDRVKVRSWDDMAKVPGAITTDDYIRFVSGICFQRRMLSLCGQYGTITAIEDHQSYQHLKVQFDMAVLYSGWYVSNEMFIEAEKEQVIISSDGGTQIAKIYREGKLIQTIEVKHSLKDIYDFINC